MPSHSASVLVLDADGQVVASSGVVRLGMLDDGRKVPWAQSTSRAAVARFHEPADNALQKRPTEHVAIRRDVAGAGWQVHVRRSVRDMQAPLVAFYWTSAAWLFLCTLCAPPLARFVAQQISAPLESLAQAANAVGRNTGASPLVAPATAPREVQVLAAELTGMAGRLTESLASLDNRVRERTSELAAMTARNDTLFTLARDGMVMVDGARVVAVNDALCRMTGQSREALIALAPEALEEPVPSALLADRAVELRARGEVRFESSLRTVHGPPLPVQVVVTAVPGAHPVRFVALQDISERRRAEYQRLHLEAQLRQSQKLEAIGTLAGGIAHDFNNALAIIAGNTELARAGLPDAHSAAVHLDSVARATGRAQALVRQILAFSRRRDEEREVVEVGALVDEAVALLRATVPAMVEVRTEVAPDLPAVYADPGQLHQVLMNLGSNAAHAMPTGGRLTLRASTSGSSTALSPKTVVLEVIDTGTGMDATTAERAFEPFFTTKPVGAGTGLGLAVAHGIVIAHGGTIEITSRLGDGTTVCLTLPSFVGPSRPCPPAAPTPISKTQSPLRILIVDDEPEIVDVLTRQLALLGHRPEGRNGPYEALDAVREAATPYDLVISDLAMPSMSGLQLASRVREVSPATPFVLCSGRVTDDDRQQAAALGVAAIIDKPFSGRRLLEVVDAACRPIEVGGREAEPRRDNGSRGA